MFLVKSVHKKATNKVHQSYLTYDISDSVTLLQFPPAMLIKSECYLYMGQTLLVCILFWILGQLLRDGEQGQRDSPSFKIHSQSLQVLMNSQESLISFLI